MYNLNWTQAQEAMREGKRVSNSNFTVAEWFAFDGRHIVDEKGYYMDKWYKGYDWQNEGWMILEDSFKPFEEDTPEHGWKEEEMTLYRNKYNLRYYRVRRGRVSYSKDGVIWWPSILTEGNLSDNPNVFEVVETPSVTLENK